MKKIFYKRSKLLGIITFLETILALFSLSYFNYIDRLNYIESINNTTNDLALLIQNMFTSTWWALIILVVILISIFSLVSFIYRDLKFLFINILLWITLLILAINIKDSFINNLSTLSIFIPIIVINIVCYFKQKKLNNEV